MKKKIQQFFICLLCVCSFNACDEHDEVLKECIIEENEVKEAVTRSTGSTTIRSIEGDTDPFVGTRQVYKVNLESPLTTTTRVRIVPSNDAILIAYGDLYLKENIITVSAGSSSFSFATLITKAANYVSISVAAEYGGDFFVGSIDRITCQAPTIKIDAPVSILPNTQFEVSTDYTQVPNMPKGYEWDCSSFKKIRDQYQSGSKIKMILQSPEKAGSYNVSVKTYGAYNQSGYKFLIGQATVPIKVMELPHDIILTDSYIPFISRLTDPIELDVFEGSEKYYDKYEWRMPEGYIATPVDLVRYSKMKIKISQTGIYKIEARGVVKIGDKTYYSDWKSMELNVRLHPFTINYKICKTHFLRIDDELNIHSGALWRDFPAYFTTNDEPYSQFFIGTDSKELNIKYYYIIDGYEYFMESLINSDPVQSTSIIYSYPGVGTPIEEVDIYYR